MAFTGVLGCRQTLQMEGTESVTAPILLQEDSDTSPEDALLIACENGDDEAVSSLLQQGRPSLERMHKVIVLYGGQAGLCILKWLACKAKPLLLKQNTHSSCSRGVTKPHYP